MLTEKHAFELLSRAYVTAVASKARAHMGEVTPHAMTMGEGEFDYGIDGSFNVYGVANGDPYPKGRGFRFQLKATKRWSIDGVDVVYDLKGDAYNKLVRQNREDGDKGVLLLLCIPENIQSAVEITHDHCLIKRSVYWTVLRGPDKDQGSVRVRIPVANLFDDAALVDILDKADRRVL